MFFIVFLISADDSWHQNKSHTFQYENTVYYYNNNNQVTKKKTLNITIESLTKTLYGYH